ncbi:MAG: hypothetical protein V1702_00345 [Candidatus Woesearchaeota archaeon]
MTTERQSAANEENAQKSTGPNDCTSTRFNAVKYGLTSECHFSEAEETTINGLYEDLKSIFFPNDMLERYLVGRMAVYMWRIQKATNLEKIHFKNLKIDNKNKIACDKALDEMFPVAKPEYKSEPLILSEDVDDYTDSLMRYEILNENRLLKLIKFLKNSMA